MTVRTTLKTWLEADDALRELGEQEARKERIEQHKDSVINDAKEDARRKLQPIEEQCVRLRSDLELFCIERRDDFAGAQSRKLTFGTVAFKRTSAVEVPDEQATLEALKARGMAGCVRVKESVDKNALREVPDALLADVGATRVEGETFTAKADRSRVVIPEG